MRNIKETLENKVNHILKKFNVKTNIHIGFEKGSTVDDIDEFTGETYQETYPDRYVISIPIPYKENILVALDVAISKIIRKNDFWIEIHFTDEDSRDKELDMIEK